MGTTDIVSFDYFMLCTVLISDCGKVFTFGLGSTGQLGHGGTKNITKVSTKSESIPFHGPCRRLLLSFFIIAPLALTVLMN